MTDAEIDELLCLAEAATPVAESDDPGSLTSEDVAAWSDWEDWACGDGGPQTVTWLVREVQRLCSALSHAARA